MIHYLSLRLKRTAILASTCILIIPISNAVAFEAGGATTNGDDSSTAIGNGWTYTKSIWSTAVGVGAKVEENSDRGTAIGFDALIEEDAKFSTAVGTRSKVQTGATQSTALGDHTLIGQNSANSTAVGQSSTIGANSENATALGQGSKVGDNSNGSTAIGSQSSVTNGTESALAIGHRATTSHDNSIALGAGSETIVGAEVDYTGYGLDSTESSAGSVAVGSASEGNRTITGVASGQRDNDAVNVQQLKAVNDTLTDEIDTIDQFAVKYDKDPSDPTIPDYTSITLGDGSGSSAPVVIKNIANGDVSPTSNQAVNGSQLYNVSQSAADIFGGGSVVNNDGTITLPTYSVQGKSYSNVGTAFEGIDSALNSLNNDIWESKKEARQAAAIGMAAASLRFDDRAGKLSLAAGGAAWRGQGAFAFGAGYTSEDQKIRANLAATTTGSHWGVGGGLSFTLN